MKVAVIGSNGYIARNFVYYLKTNTEIEVYGYDIHDESVSNIPYKKINLLDANTLNLVDTHVDFIYLFSGITGVKQGFDNYDAFIDVNEKGLIALLNKIKMDNSNARIMFPSTRLIYKGKKDIALHEDAEKECNCLYGINKLACENILKLYNKAFDISYTIFRICVPYGDLISGENSYGTIGFFKKSILENGYITLYGDGQQKRSFIHIEDLCRALYFLQKDVRSKNEIFNLGGKDVMSLLELSNVLIKKYGGELKFVPFPELEERLETGDTIFDDSKLLNLGFEYKNNMLEKL